MLTALVFPLVLTAVACYPPPPRIVGTEPKQAVPHSYYASVLDRAFVPPDWQESVITISVSIALQSRLVLRERNGKFELLRGTIAEDVDQALTSLEKAGALPLNPADAAEWFKVAWESADVTRAQFDRLHQGLTSAFSHEVSSMERRYSRLLATRQTFVYLHMPRYVVAYDNRFEHLEVTVFDTAADVNKMDPVVSWTRGIIKLSEERFRQK